MCVFVGFHLFSSPAAPASPKGYNSFVLFPLSRLVDYTRHGRRRRPDAASPAEPGRLGKARSRRRAAEEEDVRRRRALAEEVPMVEDDADVDGRTCGTFVIAGARRNALFCRVWAPAAGAETR